jgi:Zn-dependent M32 family carboxypeptidase
LELSLFQQGSVSSKRSRRGNRLPSWPVPEKNKNCAVSEKIKLGVLELSYPEVPRLAHERAAEPVLGGLIDELTRYGENLPCDSDDASLIRVARRDFQKNIKIPSDHVERATAHFSTSYDAWTRARPGNDFATMAPYLERTLDLSREYSSYFVPYNHVADPLIDDADEGMTAASISGLFDELKLQLVPMVRAICEQPAADDACLRQAFPKAAQFYLFHLPRSIVPLIRWRGR